MPHSNFKFKGKKTVEEKFCLELLKPENIGTVWLSLNLDNLNMSQVLKILTMFNFHPSIVKKNNNFILIELKCQNLAFINLSNYFSCSTYDLIYQFDLKIKPYFFPCDLNSVNYFNYEGNLPNFSHFQAFQDDENICEMKKNFMLKN